MVVKESDKAIIVDTASPWDHQVYEKEGKKTEKYQDLKKGGRSENYGVSGTSK